MQPRRSVSVTPATASKTGFDKFLDEKLRDSGFRADYEVARAEIAATDALIRALEGARAGRGISKAELARRISVKPEIVRRLLTDPSGPGARPSHAGAESCRMGA